MSTKGTECNVCAIFDIPDLIHSDNGKEFANHVFNDVCKQFDITTNKYIPSFSPSNGLVERRHRDILQALRKMLIDFNDYDNWSKYIPLVQLLVNTTKKRVTGFTPVSKPVKCSRISEERPPKKSRELTVYRCPAQLYRVIRPLTVCALESCDTVSYHHILKLIEPSDKDDFQKVFSPDGTFNIKKDKLYYKTTLSDSLVEKYPSDGRVQSLQDSSPGMTRSSVQSVSQTGQTLIPKSRTLFFE
ncbi:hypothetical protein GEMRC1_000952 [Eukaryota sp. GEM-RC1]